MRHAGFRKRRHSQIPSLLSPSTFPSLTSPALPLCLSPCLSRVPSPFNYPWHRSHKSSPSLRPPPALLSSLPAPLFIHPLRREIDFISFTLSVEAHPPAALKFLSWIQAWICRVCVVFLGYFGRKLKLTHIFFWLHTQFSPRQLTAYPPLPCVSPSTYTTTCFMFLCILEGSWFFLFKETTCFRELSALSPQNPNVGWGFLTPVAAVWHLPAWSDSTNAPTFLSCS